MSYEQTENAQTGHGKHGGYDRQDPMGWAKRPGFNPMKALAVVAGLAIFPPLGVGALAWFIWNERRLRHAGPRFTAYDGEGRLMCRKHGRHGWRTGNAAFDEHAAKIMEELAEQRRAFHEYRAEERRKRDQADFDAFQAKRAADKDESGEAPSV